MRFASISAVTAAACFVTAPSVEAAFMVEARSGGKASANYAFTGAGGDAASESSAGVGFAPGVTPGLGSIFGGNATNGDPDQYTFSYTPALDADNTTYGVGQVLNSFWNPDGLDEDEPLTATGLTGGVAGLYNVYVVWPQTGNVDTTPTTFVASGDEGDATYVVDDQNFSGTTDTGSGIGLWEIIGQVAITDPLATYTVTQTSGDNPGFVSMRGYGVFWEFVEDLPTGGLPGDANGDGTVDLADFGILRSEFGSMGDMLLADFNGDMTVDLADFGILRANFGTSIPSDIAALDAWAASIPEPATFGMFAAAGTLLLGRRRR
ncbi:MAG: PEP-CTERM sorting domain-containing protein [Planctomycetota bacterium]